MVEVIKAGFFDTLQDLGRWESIPFGVPIAGATDRFALKMVNLQLQNPENAAVMEITFKGPTLYFHEDTFICIAGAEIDVILNETKPIPLWVPVRIQKGDVLSFETLQKGVRSYVAVSGGFQTETVFGSKSWYSGVTEQSRIQKGDILAIGKWNRKTLDPKEINTSDYLSESKLTVYPGPEFEWLSNKNKTELSKPFYISNQNSRMAYILQEIVPNELPSLITVPVQPGTIQLTPSGQIIILMRDAQTTGGYPRILQLGEEAMNILAQKKTGDEVYFQLVED